MSRGTARAAVTAWVKGLPGVASSFPTFPKLIPATSWNLGPGVASAAVVVVFIAGETERRIAIGGAHSGWKRVDYTIELHIFHRSSAKDADAAQDSLDAIVETIKTALRSDRTMGGAFWQQGEQELSARYGEPRLTGTITETWAQVTFMATEMLNT